MRHCRQQRQTFSSTVLDRIKMIQCRKEAPEMTALATRFTRCHLIQLHCWAKINSLMMTSALFIFFIYIFTLIAFVPLSLFFAFLAVLMGLFNSSLFFPMWQQSEYHKFARKLVCFMCNYWHEGRVGVCLKHSHMPITGFFEACRSLLCQQVCQETMTWFTITSTVYFMSDSLHVWWNGDHISELVRLWSVQNILANTLWWNQNSFASCLPQC